MTTKQRILILLILTIVSSLFIFLQYHAATRESLIWDEKAHFRFGYFALFENDFTIDPLSGTFISQLLVLPVVLYWEFLTNIKLLPSEQFIYFRMMNALLMLVLAYSIYFYCRQRFSKYVGFIAFAFILFEPLVFANSHYVSLDIGFSLFFFIAFWFIGEYLINQNAKALVLSGISAGLLFASKVNGIVYYFSSLLFLLILRRQISLNISFKKIIVFFLAIIIGIWCTYRFSFSNLGGFTEGGNRLSNRIHHYLLSKNPKLSETFEKLMEAPLPLGNYPKIVKNSIIYNSSQKSSYFLGSLRENPGRFYIPALLYKLPLSLVIFFFIGVALVFKKKEALFIFAPFIILFVMFFSNISLRLRYILPIYPYIAIISAYGFMWLLSKNVKVKAIAVLLLLLYFLSFFSHYPYTISYVNVLSRFYGKPYTLFSDSDMNWGGGLILLKEYTEKNNIGIVKLSYYGTDNPNRYGFLGFSYGEDMCKKSCTFEKTYTEEHNNTQITAISVTNWQECGYYKNPLYSQNKIKDEVFGQFLIF